MMNGARIDRKPRWLLAAIAVAAAALGIRLLHLFFTERMNPLASSLQLDAATYDAWARALARGGDAGPTSLMQAPLYPWLLSVLYRIFGPVPAAARAFQAALGTASVVLIMLVTRRLFSIAAALVAVGQGDVPHRRRGGEISQLPGRDDRIASSLILPPHQSSCHKPG